MLTIGGGLNGNWRFTRFWEGVYFASDSGLAYLLVCLGVSHLQKACLFLQIALLFYTFLFLE